MSMKMTMQIRELEAQNQLKGARLDKMEKVLNLLLKAVSHLERSPDKKSGVRVPLTPLPETLEELEIGSQPEGS